MPNQHIGAGNISGGEQLVQLFNHRGASTVWKERWVTLPDTGTIIATHAGKRRHIMLDTHPHLRGGAPSKPVF